jgi:hypothetical protein
LSIDVNGDQTTLVQSFRGEATTDESRVVMDSQTLRPISSRRAIDTPANDEVIEVTYTDDGALIKQGDRQSGIAVPEHSYDNDTSLFLWRTIPFAEGFEASYVTIITNRRARDVVTLRVTGREMVRIDSGELECWRVEIRTGNATQTAWYRAADDYVLVKYDNDRGTIFELSK